LQAFLQFFDLILNVFFDRGNFMKTVTDVYIHERLGLADEVRQVLSCWTIEQVDLRRIVHPAGTMQTRNSDIRGFVLCIFGNEFQATPCASLQT
jgi:hypothetical protein